MNDIKHESKQNASHTPGPWRLERDKAFSLSVYGSDNFFVGDVTHEADECNATEIANACLIATAPKLLEAFEEALIMAETGIEFRREKARHIIAEAKGLAV
jgi:hypothetical protein